MIKIEPAALHEILSKQDPSFSILISLFLGTRLIDERTVTASAIRHQFLVPMADALSASELSLKVEANGPVSDIVPRLKIGFESCLKRDLVLSLEEKMIWVFGSPRTGSTWLTRDILGRLPSQVRPTDDTGTRLIDEMGIGEALGVFEVKPEDFYRIDTVVTPRDPGPDMDMATGKRISLGNSLFQRVLFKNYNRPEAMLGDITRRAVREMIREAAFNQVLLHWGILDFDRVVFKAPNEGQAADLIMDALPRARMIFLIRDGRDVLKSRFSAFASRILAETEDAGLRRTAIAYYAHQWNWQIDIVRSAYDAHAPERRLHLSYEELRRESQDAFLGLIRFVGATMEPSAVKQLIADARLENFPQAERGSHLPRQEGKIGGYLSTFTPDEIQLMTAIMAENLARYGYDTSSPAVPTVNERFALVADRLPTDISLFVANGLYHDLWCSDHATLICSLPYSISSISLTCQVPREFLSVYKSWTLTFSAKNCMRKAIITNADVTTITIPVTAEKDELLTCTLSSDKTIFPNVEFSQADKRALSFHIVSIGIEKLAK